MTMKFTQLTTYWNAGDAHLVISFLDELRDVLWATYGDEIIEMHQAENKNRTQDNEHPDSTLDDEIKF